MRTGKPKCEMEAVLTREEMLTRMLRCDASANGLFITGVRTTGIYCLPSCPARKPKAGNVTFYFSEAAARKAGLRACKRCRPDEFYAGVDRARELANSVEQLLAAAPNTMKNVAMLAEAASVSVARLYAIVETQLHTTPGALIARYKIIHARDLLAHSNLSIAQVAFESGFESLSTFYTWFRRCTGETPGAYRKGAVSG